MLVGAKMPLTVANAVAFRQVYAAMGAGHHALGGTLPLARAAALDARPGASEEEVSDQCQKND
jgi:hypothetical protein